MKILHYQLGSHGGSETFFVQLVQALDQKGVEQKVVIGPNRMWRDQLPEAVEVIAETAYRTLSLNRFHQRRHIAGVIDRWQPNSLLSWMRRGSRMLPTRSRCKKFARLGDLESDLRDYRKADTLICVAPPVAEHARRLGWRGGIEVISNFKSTAQADPVQRNQFNTPMEVPLICVMGRLTQGKGVDMIIRSLLQIPLAHLWIVGDGKEKSSLEHLSKTLNLDHRIHFLGWQQEPLRFLAAADVLGFASRKEALGNVILEAWSQKVPVVSTHAEGPKWLIRDHNNGRLVDIDDEVAFADAIKDILNDPLSAETMTINGFHSLQSEFSQQAVVDRYLDLLVA